MTARVVFNREPLQRERFAPLPLGSVRPRGWLLDQCRIQARGITGRIGEVWPDLGPDNIWLGGTREGWERGPYYLDGLVPMAHILNDETLKAAASDWIDSILGMQDSSGWIGPAQTPGHPPYDIWPITVLLKALSQHYEATDDPRVIPAMDAYFHWLRRSLPDRRLAEWQRYRWADLVLSIHWLYNRTGAGWLLDLARAVAGQGYDWRAHFDKFPYRDKTPRQKCALETHVVNNAMAIKTGGVWWRQTGEEADRDSVHRALTMLDTYHGQVTGVFSGDEHYAGKDPTQGTELCAVVEYMYSLEELISISGDASFGDRLERIAYNALPAQFTPDMWGHQYDQQVNQVLCTIAPRHWTNNGDDSNIFGLEPNFGCCTANLHQGWPKLVKSMWMVAPDGSPAAVVHGPSEVTTRVSGVDVRIVSETYYPFEGAIRFTVEVSRPVQFTMWLRIPGWAEGALIHRSFGPDLRPAPGRFTGVVTTWKPGEQVTLTLPMDARVERRYRGSVSVVRGPLVYALRIGEEFRTVRGEPPARDQEVVPTTSWNYGLVLNADSRPQHLALQERHPGQVPFAPDAAPVTLKVRARRIPGWELVSNSAGPLPHGPVMSAAPDEIVELIPYGSTCLRIAEFPEVKAEPERE